ncbi:MAG: hypothetical protein M1401_17505 [Chloroflexi bacterium]|nr:hypothetical protein [Chloroflexota bacterium]
MRRLNWPAVLVILLALIADLSIVADFGQPWRPLLVFAFLVIGPGLPLVRLLRLSQPGAVLTLAVVLSLALDTAVAEGLVMTRLWSAGAALAILIIVAVAGAGADLLASSRRESRGLLQ